MSLYLGENKIADNTCSRNIGEIVASTIPLNDAGLHLLDGAVISNVGSYAKFVNYIAGLISNYPDLFTTEANWQSAVSTYGVCGKFVYDSTNNTVRLPKYSNKIYTSAIATTAGVKGNGMTLGMTGVQNGGLVDWGTSDSRNISITTQGYGQPLNTHTAKRTIASGDQNTIGVTTDASKSGLIADLSNITTSLDGYYYIVIANSVKTNIEVDIDEVMTDLNGKADVDLTNTSPTIAFATTMNNAEIRTVVETYVNGTSWYRIYSDGWCEQGGQVAPNGTNQDVTVTFLKPFIDTNYFFVKTNNNNYTSSYTAKYLNNVITYSTSQVVIGVGNKETGNTHWRACGYIS